MEGSVRFDAHLSAEANANLDWTRFKAYLGLNCRVNSVTHPEAHFRKWGSCSRHLGINSESVSDCCLACQRSDWFARHQRFHGAMLSWSGEAIPEEGYPRPLGFRGLSMATGDDHDWTHAIWERERLKMLQDCIQHVLMEHEVSTDRALHQVVHAAVNHPPCAWTRNTRKCQKDRRCLSACWAWRSESC